MSWREQFCVCRQNPDLRGSSSELGVGKQNRENSEFKLSYKTLGCEEKRDKRTKARERRTVWGSCISFVCSFVL